MVDGGFDLDLRRIWFTLLADELVVSAFEVCIKRVFGSVHSFYLWPGFRHFLKEAKRGF